ncbi:MAG: hypothetical protein Q9162_001408 [Coniocarpon cinnabarinum]
MPSTSDSDTIKILVSSDSHVGYNERDPLRGDDSWETFQEVMEIAKERDVDMVLLAGDLFHDNVPSRKALYQVMRALRMNCLGDKPCELEILSDGSENFAGAFPHANYEDQDINVAIPVFSIHGNHDDPSGEGSYAALDLLSVSGLVNYYGKTPESDKINVKPVLLQKGHTKLALYGLSNVRDERMHRTFRQGDVKFFRPNVQKDDWFNIVSVHQNRYKHTGTDYLPQNFLPDFMDLVIWGHEHECLIDPQMDYEMGFHVVQPGSTVATSLIAGEAAQKHASILRITGHDFESEAIPLRTVRPFVTRDIVLQDEPGMKKLAKRENNRSDIVCHLESIVEQMIEGANSQWLANQQSNESGSDTQLETPLPLIRLRVEYSAPEGGKFDCENPQRFSRRFAGKVANVNDVVQFHRKKTATRRAKDGAEIAEEQILSKMTIDSIKVEKLVREYLNTQSLTILPQNSFGDAVTQFVDKDDKHAMEAFVEGSLGDQVKHLLSTGEADEADIKEALDKNRAHLEELFAGGNSKKYTKRKFKPKPDTWDSDMDGDWEDQPGALQLSDNDEQASDDDGVGSNAGSVSTRTTTTRGRGRGRGRGAANASGTTRATAAARGSSARKDSGATGRKSKKKVADELDDDDVGMVDGADEEEHAVSQPSATAGRQVSSSRSTSSRQAPTRAAAPRQSKLNFSQTNTQQRPTSKGPFLQELVNDNDAAGVNPY